MADLRNARLKAGINEADAARGRELIAAMEAASGGYDTWAGFRTGSFIQTADWYENVTDWTVNPQRFAMRCELGGPDGRLTLLNGPREGAVWEISGQEARLVDGTSEPSDAGMALHKQTYKSYWFQFPFKIREADIVAYAGQRTIEGTLYDIVYATWHSAAPNSKYDQFVLYLHPDTQLPEWLEFTIREIHPMASGISRFTEYTEVQGLQLPKSQYITQGTLSHPMAKLHENHYEDIRFE